MLSVILGCDHVLSHIIQQDLAAEIEWLSSLKFPTTQNFKYLLLLIALTLGFYYLPPLDIVQTSYLAEMLHIWWYHKKIM